MKRIKEWLLNAALVLCGLIVMAAVGAGVLYYIVFVMLASLNH